MLDLVRKDYEKFFELDVLNMKIEILKNEVNKEFLKEFAKEQFGNMVKAVVDIEKEIVAIGGEWHADAEQVLVAQGSKSDNLWGINLYPEAADNYFIEFVSLINIKPSQNNRSQEIESEEIKNKIKAIIKKWIKD